MTIQLKIADVVAECLKLEPKGNQNLIRTFLAAIQQVQDRGFYTDLFQQTFHSQKSRNLLSWSLLGVWEYCDKNGYPYFNFMAIAKDTGYPSDGVMGWYEQKFGTLKGYYQYCDAAADKAIDALKTGAIEFIH